MMNKTTFTLSISASVMLTVFILVYHLRKQTSDNHSNIVNYTTTFERTGIGESNFTIPGSTGGLRVGSGLIMSSSFTLKSSGKVEISQYIDPKKDVLRKDYFRLWQLQPPFWLEKFAESDTLYVYCGADTLYILLSEFP